MSRNLRLIYKEISNEDSNEICSDLKFSRDENGDTLLHYAVCDENFRMIKKLVDIGACPFILNKDAMTPLSIAASSDNLSILKFLVETFKNEIIDDDKAEMLAIAVSNGVISNVRYLLDSEFDCNVLYREDPIIYWAIQSGQLEIVKLLYDYGANLNAANDYNMTPLYDASANNLIDIVKFLIEKGALLDEPSNDGCTPLMIACCYDNIEIVKLLIAGGSNIEACDKKSETSLLSAIKLGNIEIVKLLLENGANKDIKNRKNKGVKEYCKHIKNIKIKQKMIRVLEKQNS
jgi:ankyrin repeat protein